ncbi:type II CAAX prenyl endopeptidase Rce1 family protein [Bacillus alveayuensis]|uniref:CPBP family glutamic-type intramembrane protease n=1 Tax=Aeribacillus alveayuensis TaxID=279215 RepID=UPI0005D0EE44|nr:CPBP family glutamic-type intramembrane protease [Bacillus alveayuensis]
MKNEWKLVFLLTLLGVIGVISIIPYQLAKLRENIKLDDSQLMMLTILGVLQNTFIVFVCTFLGIRLQKSTKLDIPHLRAWVSKTEQPPFSWRWLGIGIFVTLFSSLLIILLDMYVFMPNIDTKELDKQPNWWQGLLAVFYGGITEEIMMRLFGMTLIIWILARVTRQKETNIHSVCYWIGIIGIAIFFGISHLPSVIGIFGELSLMLVLRTVVLNGILGIWFGYLYWKKGLEYAILSHMAADLFLHVLFPIILKVTF